MFWAEPIWTSIGFDKKETRLQSNRVSKNKLWEIKCGNRKE